MSLPLNAYVEFLTHGVRVFGWTFGRWFLLGEVIRVCPS